MWSSCAKWSEGVLTEWDIQTELTEFAELMLKSTVLMAKIEESKAMSQGRNLSSVNSSTLEVVHTIGITKPLEGSTLTYVSIVCSLGKIHNHSSQDCYLLKCTQAKNGQAASQS